MTELNNPEDQLEVLSEQQCLELLGSRDLGRITFDIAGQPEIFPVNYTCDGAVVVFRTAGGTKLEQALAATLPDWTWRRPAGGLCLWVRLPRGNAEELARHALRHGVGLVPGPTCSPRDAWETWLRLPFVLEQEQMLEGIARLARAWEAYAPAARPGPARAAPAPHQVDVLV